MKFHRPFQVSSYRKRVRTGSNTKPPDELTSRGDAAENLRSPNPVLDTTSTLEKRLQYTTRDTGVEYAYVNNTQ